MKNNNIIVCVALIVAVLALVFAFYGKNVVGLAPGCQVRQISTYDLAVGNPLVSSYQTFTIEGKTYGLELVGGTDTEATLKLTDLSNGRYKQKSITESSSVRLLDLEIAVTYADESTALNIVESKGDVRKLPVCL